MDLFLLAAKPVLVFITGYLFIRLMKKHSMGTTTPFDFLVTVVLGTILAEPIVSTKIEIAFFYAGIIVLLHIVSSKIVLWPPTQAKNLLSTNNTR